MECQAVAPNASDLPGGGRKERNTEICCKIVSIAQVNNALTLITLQIQIQFPRFPTPDAMIYASQGYSPLLSFISCQSL